jgi:uncharacterized protein with FMN-binding domain
MKRIVLTMVAIVGVGGLIAIMQYNPEQGSGAVAGSSTGPASSPVQATTTSAASPSYRDGSYTGTTSDVGYGPVQVQAVISGGRLTAVKLLQMPSDERKSAEIASVAGPELVQEAISAQSSKVDIVSGATQDSQGFMDSLASALSKAKA